MSENDRTPPISLSVCAWSAWAPGITDREGWRNWAAGDAEITGPTDPDVKFVSPMMRRRLSKLSRMAFCAATDCLERQTDSAAFVFCSRYGEYPRSFSILEGLAAGEPASAAAFSMSVHNTATSLFSIEMSDISPATAVAGGEATLESGFLEAWGLLTDGSADAVLLVYHDACLPDLYRDQPTSVTHDAAFAMLLKRPERSPVNPAISLDWRTSGNSAKTPGMPENPALEVVRLLSTNDGSFSMDTGRLVWTWSVEHAAA